MRRFLTLALVTLFAIGGTVSAVAGQPADDMAANVTLVKLDQGDITDSIYPVVLVRIDGEPVTGGHRKYLELVPGEHVIRLKADKAAIKEHQMGVADNYPVPRQLPEQDFTVMLEAGMNYKIAVRRDGSSWSDFKPFVLKSWPAGTEEPQAGKE